MWAAYTTQTALTGWALARRIGSLPIPAGAARVAGGALISTGVGLCVVAMSRFGGAQELTGTRNQTLTTKGVYRYSHNPQYLGYLLALTGAGLVRRSSAALATTASLAAVYAAWIPVEEQHSTGLYGHTYNEYTRRTRRWWGQHGPTRLYRSRRLPTLAHLLMGRFTGKRMHLPETQWLACDDLM